jgi:hypothetical protein
MSALHSSHPEDHGRPPAAQPAARVDRPVGATGRGTTMAVRGQLDDRHWRGQPRAPHAAQTSRWPATPAWPSSPRPGPSGAGSAHDARRRRPVVAADRQRNHRPGGDAWSSPRLPSSPSPSPYLLVPSRAEVLLPREVTTMCSSQAGGIEGHQWSLHRTSGTRLPCRIVCDCGWTSTAGQRTAVLLQLKGHLEDSLHNGARLLPAHDQPPAEIPTTPSN